MTYLIDWVYDARQRTCELVADLSDSQLIGPRLATVNPLLWEIGHVAWFQEKWVLRRVARPHPSPGLPDRQVMGPRLATVNPLLWEMGHVAWFQEKWVLRRVARPESSKGVRNRKDRHALRIHAQGVPPLPSLRPDADALYDSAAIPHD